MEPFTPSHAAAVPIESGGFRRCSDGKHSTCQQFWVSRLARAASKFFRALERSRVGTLFGRLTLVITAASALTLPAIGEAAALMTEYNFAGQPDAANPTAKGLVLAANMCLYGISRNGGANNAGAIFRSTILGKETVVYSFGGETDGKNPTSIVVGGDRGLYGTTEFGGSTGNGTIWKLTVNSACGPAIGTLTTLYSFTGGTDGNSPDNLVYARDGNLYGTTPTGGTGARPLGTIFKLSPSGSGFATFYSFAGRYANDGENPTSLIQGSDGNLYGTAGGGDSRRGAGAIFRITVAGVETVTHKFGANYHDGSGDGNGPISLTQGGDGILYGTTAGGNLPSNGGTVFELTPDGTTFSTLYGFSGGNDGLVPKVVLLKNGDLYGITSDGGDYNFGSIFKIAGGVKSVLYSFTGVTDGAEPLALIPGLLGAVYGTTSTAGNSNNDGTLFRVTIP